ncbi:hypothetical protein WJX74_002818 [Apatococcus lobatus]|uniref:F-box domain-containing protein n=1 Tax=Apatococcus lobatus TaxID=904363 RepID=A0AAW1Q627_9CHLO
MLVPIPREGFWPYLQHVVNKFADADPTTLSNEEVVEALRAAVCFEPVGECADCELTTLQASVERRMRLLVQKDLYSPAQLCALRGLYDTARALSAATEGRLNADEDLERERAVAVWARAQEGGFYFLVQAIIQMKGPPLYPRTRSSAGPRPYFLTTGFSLAESSRLDIDSEDTELRIREVLGPSMDEQSRRTIVPPSVLRRPGLRGFSGFIQMFREWQGPRQEQRLQTLPRDVLERILSFLSPFDVLSLRAGLGRWPAGENPLAAYARERRARAVRMSSIDGLSDPDGIIGHSGRTVKAMLCCLIVTLRNMLGGITSPNAAGPSQAMRDMQCKSAEAMMSMPQIELYWYAGWYLMVVAACTDSPRGCPHMLLVHPLPDPPTVLPAAATMIHGMLLWGVRQRYYGDHELLTRCVAWRLGEDASLFEDDVSSTFFRRYNPRPCFCGKGNPDCVDTCPKVSSRFVPQTMAPSSVQAMIGFATRQASRDSVMMDVI